MAVDQSEVPGEIAIRRACTDSDVASFRELVLEYYEFLNEDISFQAGSSRSRQAINMHFSTTTQASRPHSMREVAAPPPLTLHA